MAAHFLIAFVLALLLWLGCRCTRPKPAASRPRLKHVVITGGSSGIGKSLARLFVANGSKVTLIARDLEKLKRTQEELDRISADRVSVASLDVTASENRIEECIAEATQQSGPIDLLIHSAGFATCGPFLHLDLRDFNTMIEVHYLSAVKLVRSVLPSMMKCNRGSIVLISSVASQVGVYGYSAYGPAKCALNALAETLNAELSRYSLNVMTVFPPDTDTPGFQTENINKELSKSAGLYGADAVASKIYESVLVNDRYVTFGFEGWACRLLTSGGCPYNGLVETLLQICLYPVLRIAFVIERLRWKRLITKLSSLECP